MSVRARPFFLGIPLDPLFKRNLCKPARSDNLRSLRCGSSVPKKNDNQPGPETKFTGTVRAVSCVSYTEKQRGICTVRPRHSKFFDKASPSYPLERPQYAQIPPSDLDASNLSRLLSAPNGIAYLVRSSPLRLAWSTTTGIPRGTHN